MKRFIEVSTSIKCRIGIVNSTDQTKHLNAEDRSKLTLSVLNKKKSLNGRLVYLDKSKKRNPHFQRFNNNKESVDFAS